MVEHSVHHEAWRRRKPHRAPVLSGERLDDRLGYRVSVRVEREVAGVEIAHHGRWHSLLHEFRGRRQDKLSPLN